MSSLATWSLSLTNPPSGEGVLWFSIALSSDGTYGIAGSGSNTGIWYTTNAGATWTQSNKSQDTFNSVALSSDGLKGIAASHSGIGLWYTTDSGANWTISDQTNYFNLVALSSGLGTSIGVAGSYLNTGLWYTTNAGVNWTQSVTIPPSGQTHSFHSVALSSDGLNGITASLSIAGLWYTTNAGVTWTLSDQQTLYFSSLALSSDGLKGIAGSHSDNGLWYTTNAGANWTESLTNPPLGETDTFSCVALSSDGLKGIAGSSTTDNGLWYTTNAGATWSQSNNNSDFFNSVALSSDGTYGVAGAFFTGLWYTTDSGASWIQSNNTTGSFFSTALSSDGNYAIAGGPGLWYNGVNVVPCFNKGSKILCFNKETESEEYRVIESLRKGDLVKTYKHGYVSINMIGTRTIFNGNENHHSETMLYKCTPEKYPELLEDLIITGHHSVLVDEFKEDQRSKTNALLGDIYITDDKYRLPVCLDKRAAPYTKEGSYKIYHLALEHDSYYKNYGIYANGLLVETSSKRYLKELSNLSTF